MILIFLLFFISILGTFSSFRKKYDHPLPLGHLFLSYWNTWTGKRHNILYIHLFKVVLKDVYLSTLCYCDFWFFFITKLVKRRAECVNITNSMPYKIVGQYKGLQKPFWHFCILNLLCKCHNIVSGFKSI